MSDQPSSDPHGQQPPSAPSSPPPGPSSPSAGSPPPSSSAGQAGAYQQPPPPQGGYGQPYSGGYVAPAPAAPRKPLDLARLAFIAAWVVLGLFALHYLYFISNDDNGGEFVDRFFGGMDRLGEGILYAGILHVAAVWLGRNQSRSG